MYFCVIFGCRKDYSHEVSGPKSQANEKKIYKEKNTDRLCIYMSCICHNRGQAGTMKGDLLACLSETHHSAISLYYYKHIDMLFQAHGCVIVGCLHIGVA